MFVFSIASAFSENYWEFILLRTVYGITIGFFSPLNFTILGEITPKKRRGTIMTLLGLFYTGGEIFCLVVAYFTTNNL
jgi:MFS family permease